MNKQVEKGFHNPPCPRSLTLQDLTENRLEVRFQAHYTWFGPPYESIDLLLSRIVCCPFKKLDVG